MSITQYVREQRSKDFERLFITEDISPSLALFKFIRVGAHSYLE